MKLFLLSNSFLFDHCFASVQLATSCRNCVTAGISVPAHYRKRRFLLLRTKQLLIEIGDLKGTLLERNSEKSGNSTVFSTHLLRHKKKKHGVVILLRSMTSERYLSDISLH